MNAFAWLKKSAELFNLTSPDCVNDCFAGVGRTAIIQNQVDF